MQKGAVKKERLTGIYALDAVAWVSICYAVNKEEARPQEENTANGNYDLFGLVSRCVPSAGDGWHPYTLKLFLKQRRWFVGEVLLPLKNPPEP